MSQKIYVGNLPYSASDADLQQNFSEFGDVVSATVMTDRDTGRSKGFGFVEMGNPAQAQAAIEGLNGQSVSGRALVVNLARPRDDSGPRGGGGGGYRSGNGGGYRGGGGRY
ncbi:RNA-binding protein [Ottowia beijingensis]|uniref:RNA recognition motif domain-containing protein n=1 Tax=Ottowia beijingensis TaxID=1207057 RepID=UPI002FDB5EA3